MFAVAPAFTASVVGEATSWYPGGLTTWVRDADAGLRRVSPGKAAVTTVEPAGRAAAS